MFKKKLITMGIVLVGVVSMAGCGKRLSVPESQIPNNLATYLFLNTPDDGIEQTKDLQVVKTELGDETKNDDGTVTIHAQADISDKSFYKGSFDLVYEKVDKDTWELKDVDYIDRDKWEITPTKILDEEIIKDLLVEREAATYAGDRVKLSQDNVTNIVIKDTKEDADGSTLEDVSFDASTTYVTYHTDSRLTVNHDINGYHIKGAVIDDYSCELTPNYAFEISDEELIKMVSDKALLVGNQSVSLDDITALQERKDTFNEKDLSMTIVAKAIIDKEAYTAQADIYYTYRISDDGKYWVMDSYHGTNFKVNQWKDINGLYMGYVGGDAVTMELFDSEDNMLHAVLMSDTAASERELVGEINEEDMTVEFKDPDTEKVLLKGDFSADLMTFTGNYGKQSKWALISQATYKDVLEEETGDET